jgi:hypothetical protein
MGVTVVQCKVGEEYQVVVGLMKERKAQPRFIFTILELYLKFSGRQDHLFREVMRLARDVKGSQTILMNPFGWNEVVTSATELKIDLEEDSDNENSAGASKGQTIQLVDSLISWYQIHSRHSSSSLTIVTSSVPPIFARMLSAVSNGSEPIASSGANESETGITLARFTIPKSSSCVCVRGDLGSGRTRSLHDLATRFHVEWLRVHEIVNCELGESGLTIRRHFTKASGYRPSIVVMDDADLIFGTSGRIMREIIEEIGCCISEFAPGVKMIIAVEREAKLDHFIGSKIDFYIDL